MNQERVGGGFAPGSLPGIVDATSTEGAGAVAQDADVNQPDRAHVLLVRHSERNITRTRGRMMLQRWLGTVLLYCEQKFKRVKGFVGIAQVTSTIEAEQAEQQPVQTKKAA